MASGTPKGLTLSVPTLGQLSHHPQRQRRHSGSPLLLNILITKVPFQLGLPGPPGPPGPQGPPGPLILPEALLKEFQLLLKGRGAMGLSPGLDGCLGVCVWKAHGGGWEWLPCPGHRGPESRAVPRLSALWAAAACGLHDRS